MGKPTKQVIMEREQVISTADTEIIHGTEVTAFMMLCQADLFHMYPIK